MCFIESDQTLHYEKAIDPCPGLSPKPFFPLTVELYSCDFHARGKDAVTK